MTLNNSEKWGYSFLGTTLGVLSMFVAPIMFKCINKSKLYRILPWFSCFGSGIILALIFNHNIADAVEILSFNWKSGSVFLTGVITNYIITYFFTSDDHCCEMEQICSDCPDSKPDCCNENKTVELNVISPISEGNDIENNDDMHRHESLPNKHGVKHWVISLLIGDACCNFVDGLLISSAFLLCSHSLGWITTLAVVLHEMSHEIGDFAIMLSSGITFKKAVFYNFLSALASYIGWVLINSLNYIDGVSKPAAYMVLYGSGVLTALVMNMLPKFIKHKTLTTQRLRILVVIVGMALATTIFAFLPHCEAAHGHHDGDDHGSEHSSEHSSEHDDHDH